MYGHRCLDDKPKRPEESDVSPVVIPSRLTKAQNDNSAVDHSWRSDVAPGSGVSIGAGVCVGTGGCGVTGIIVRDIYTLAWGRT